MSCFFGSLLTMRCDVLSQTTEQDENSGEFIRTWGASESIACSVAPVSNKGRQGAAKEEFSHGKALYDQYIYIVTYIDVTEGSRITNIRDSSDNVAYQESRTSEPTIFEVLGKTPIIDGMFGSIQGYKMLCNRAEVQENSNAEQF